jgi:hypothetical protein
MVRRIVPGVRSDARRPWVELRSIQQRARARVGRRAAAATGADASPEPLPGPAAFADSPVEHPKAIGYIPRDEIARARLLRYTSDRFKPWACWQPLDDQSM